MCSAGSDMKTCMPCCRSPRSSPRVLITTIALSIQPSLEPRAASTALHQPKLEWQHADARSHRSPLFPPSARCIEPCSSRTTTRHVSQETLPRIVHSLQRDALEPPLAKLEPHGCQRRSGCLVQPRGQRSAGVGPVGARIARPRRLPGFLLALPDGPCRAGR